MSLCSQVYLGRSEEASEDPTGSGAEDVRPTRRQGQRKATQGELFRSRVEPLFVGSRRPVSKYTNTAPRGRKTEGIFRGQATIF